MPSTSTAVVPTVGEIARRVGVPIHRVEYIIRARNIEPACRAGSIRVFTDADVELIASEIRRIDSTVASRAHDLGEHAQRGFPDWRTLEATQRVEDER